MFRAASAAQAALHALLTDYYREGEDTDTSTAEIDDFISCLLELLDKGVLQGDVAYDGQQASGFVLYTVDGADFPFSEHPGMGTIAEVGVIPGIRRHHWGKALVQRAENALWPSVTEMYVYAHPDAATFWQKCGYLPTGDIAGNGLPIRIKHL